MFRRPYTALNAYINIRRLSITSSLRSEMPFTFASPGQVFYKDKNVKQIDVPSLSGSFGILAEHVPTLGCLRPGIVSVIEEDGSLKKYFVSSGTVTVNSDSSVQILAEEAITLDMLDHVAIREGLSKAIQTVSSASTEESKAEAQISLDCWEALNKAIEDK